MARTASLVLMWLIGSTAMAPADDGSSAEPARRLLVVEYSCDQRGRLSLRSETDQTPQSGATFLPGDQQRAVLPLSGEGNRSLVLAWETPSDEVRLWLLKVIDLKGKTLQNVPLSGVRQERAGPGDASEGAGIRLLKANASAAVECRFEIAPPEHAVAKPIFAAPPETGSNSALAGLLAIGVLLGVAGAGAMVCETWRSVSTAWGSPGTAYRPWRTLAGAVPVLAWALIFLSAFRLSGSAGVVGVGLDASWPMVVEHAAQHGWQWGRDIVYTFGPLGFLHSEAGLGGFVRERSLAAWAHALLVAYAAWRCGMMVPAILRGALWLWLIAFPPTDVLLCAMIGCMLLTPLSRGKLQWVELSALLAAYALMSLVKFTIFTTAVAVITLFVTHELLQRRWWRAGMAALLPVGCFLLFWTVAGQRIASVPSWLRYSFQIAEGFNTMSSPPAPAMLEWALALAGLLLILGAIAAWRVIRCHLSGVVWLCVVAGCAFISWKHGFVRADVHVTQFFTAAFPYAGLLVAAIWVYPRRGTVRRMPVWLQVPALLALPLSIAPLSRVEGSEVNWGRLAASLKRSAAIVASTLRGDAKLPQITDISSKQLSEWRLDRIKARAHDAPVDVINFQQGYALFNGLNFRPRPVFQSYSSYTPALQELNLAHYRSTAAPSYLLFRLETIDRRLPWLDDGPLMLDLLTGWRPCLREKGFLLLQKTGAQGAWKEIESKEARWGRMVKVPAPKPHSALAIRVEADRSTAGRLKRFAYQGRNATISLRTAGGAKISRTFIPEMASRGVLLSPWIGNTDELLAWQTGRHSEAVTSFSLTPWEGHAGEFKERFRYTLMEWEPATAASDGPTERLEPYPFLPAFPQLLRPAMDVQMLNGLEACCARAPTTLEFPLQPGVSGLTGRFLAECSPVQTEPERVGIHARIVTAGGKELYRFERTLLPQVEGFDAEEQFLDLDFPAATDDSPRLLILESSTNMTRQTAFCWWGPLAWKTTGE